MTHTPAMGVCYYPEHWTKDRWAKDAAQMAALGLSHVRIGEFAWALMEPSPGTYDWAWLDEAIETLANAGLKVILGTPTATPPKWLVDAYPEILAWDKDAKPRTFGSRRHYCFSSPTYREHTRRIVTAMADRYGQHAAVIGWQTDNEFGCHDTVRSYSPAARDAFRPWLKARYKTIDALNDAWGTVFWSQIYRDFDEIDLPNLTVTEPNPSHVLDFYRFSSDQVLSYHHLQTDILRAHSPERDIYHNAMGFFFDFDHYALGAAVDSLGWDSYPLGFLDVAPYSEADKRRYRQQGHPDFAGFHHDLYRGCNARFLTLEQQPGPVNWAHHNAIPAPGMVRLWGLETLAHGGEAVTYFRWRQAPFAQEQMHAGLLRPDHQPAPGLQEASDTRRVIEQLDWAPKAQAKVALIFSYDAVWLFEAQPQGQSWSYPMMAMEWYSTARRFGVDIDIISPDADFSGYDVILAPSLPIITDDLITRLETSGAQIVCGPRTGSKTPSLCIPPELAPGALGRLIDLTIPQAESLPETVDIDGTFGDLPIKGKHWRDDVITDLAPMAVSQDGHGLYYADGQIHYLTTVPDTAFFGAVLEPLLERAGLTPVLLPEDVRVVRRGAHRFAMNYGTVPHPLPPALVEKARFIIGAATLAPADISIWTDDQQEG